MPPVHLLNLLVCERVLSADNLTQTEKKLSNMASLQCDVCVPEIDTFYDASLDIVESNQRILSMAVQNSGRFLEPRRVVVLRDEVISLNLFP